MSSDPVTVQQSEEAFRRSLNRFGWMQPLLTFISMMGFGVVLYALSQMAEIDSRFPPGFLLGLAGGFLSTAVIFYFYEVVFQRRMERRAWFAHQSGTRRRMGVLAARKGALTGRQNGLLTQVTALSPGGIPAFTPTTRRDAEAMLALAGGLIGTLMEWNAIDGELAAALRDNIAGEAEEGDLASLERALDQLLSFDVQRQQRDQMHAELLAEMNRLRTLLPGLAEAPAQP